MSKSAYAAAGVDIDLEATAIRALIKNLTYRRKGKGNMMARSGTLPGCSISAKRHSRSRPMVSGRRCWSPTGWRTGAPWVSTALR